MSHYRRLTVIGLLTCLGLPALFAPGAKAVVAAAEPRETRIQQFGDVTYFHVRFDRPKDLWTDQTGIGMDADMSPRLVCQDGHARAVYQRQPGIDRNVPGRMEAVAPAEVGDVPAAPRQARPRQPRTQAAIEGLEFVGQLKENGEAKFLLIYPTESRRGRMRERFGLPPSRRPEAVQVTWVEAPVTVDFGKATKVSVPAEARERKELAAKPRKVGQHSAGRPLAQPAPGAPQRIDPVPPGGRGEEPQPMPQPPVRDDLEGLWAEAQIQALAQLQIQTTDFGFYSFAQQATARKYGVPADAAPMFRGGNWQPGRDVEFIDRQLYETTTGAAAITESLQLQRMLGQWGPDNGARNVPISKVQGIDIAEHPWKDMMAGKVPAEEPMAKLVPNDNYYISFKSIRKFIEFSELLDQWGTNLVRAYEVHSRDYRLKERYEQQLCLKSTWMGKTVGPAVIRGIAITGNDAYLREGTDVTIIFQVVNKQLFLGAVEQFVAEARKQFAGQLQENKADYQGVEIESFTSPLREVSLHRASVDDYVIYSNSAAGLRRVLDTYKGRGKALADSLDFQYMRTVFRADEKEEDGFAFLSDPFIRQLVGPASKIKEKRRLEALTSLSMMTHGALFTAWETGKLPPDQKALFAAANLKEEEVPVPDGKSAAWDAKQQMAVSDVYNTALFTTPLVELPIDKVTQREADEYNRFRMEYLGLWRRYFDPIGMRLHLTDNQVKVDTYILPLIQNTSYNELRRIAGGGSVTLDTAGFSPNTLFQFMIHLSPDINDRQNLILGDLLGGPRGRGSNGFLDLASMLAWGLDPVGKWFFVRFDESPVYAQLAEMARNPEASFDGDKVARLVFQIPVVLGLDVRNPITFAGSLAAFRTGVMQSLPGALTWEPMPEPYKGVSIVRIQATPAGARELHGILSGRGEPFLPAIYYAMIDGAFYLTLNEPALRDVIDRAQLVKEGKAQTVEINSSLYLSPAAANKTKDIIRWYLEGQAHHQAISNLSLWYALERAGVLTETDALGKNAATAHKFLGFVPVSPDGAGYRYEAKTDEIVNQRHGSARRPQEHKTMADDAPLNQLLEQLRTIRADLSFHEDGIQTVLTMERQKTK